MKYLAAVAALVVLTGAGPALADDNMIRLQSGHAVAETADRLVSAAESAGATVFARIDHGAGARAAGSDIGASEPVIFGNPMIGTKVLTQNRLAGVILPQRVLVYEDETGEVWLAHEDLAERLDDLDGLEDASQSIAPLVAALEKLTSKAAEN